MKYLKKLNMICFSVMELKQLFKIDYLNKAHIEMRKRGYSLEDLKNDKAKMIEVVNKVISGNIKKKEDVEIFIALTSCVEFYNKNSQICFVLKNSYNLNSDVIQNLSDLKNAVEESTLTDFSIFSDSGLRQFQLKQYRGVLKTEELSNFLKEKLSGYGNDIGEVNLLIMLQGVNGGKVISRKDYKMEFQNIDYHKINSNLKLLNLKFSGQVLIKYNEANKFNVINQVYPEVKTTRIVIDQNYLAGKDLYN